MTLLEFTQLPARQKDLAIARMLGTEIKHALFVYSGERFLCTYSAEHETAEDLHRRITRPSAWNLFRVCHMLPEDAASTIRVTQEDYSHEFTSDAAHAIGALEMLRNNHAFRLSIHSTDQAWLVTAISHFGRNFNAYGLTIPEAAATVLFEALSSFAQPHAAAS